MKNLLSSFVEKLTSFIIKFFKTIHKFITLLFFYIYLFTLNPKKCYEYFKKYHLSYLKLDYRIIFKLKYLLFIYRLILYFNALFGAGIIIFYLNPLNEILNSFINYINFYTDNIFIIKFKT